MLILLRKMFGSEREEVTGGCRIVYNEQLYDWYRSSNNIGVIKLRRMRLAGRVACVWGEVKYVPGFGWET